MCMYTFLHTYTTKTVWSGGTSDNAKASVAPPPPPPSSKVMYSSNVCETQAINSYYSLRSLDTDSRGDCIINISALRSRALSCPLTVSSFKEQLQRKETVESGFVLGDIASCWQSSDDLLAMGNVDDIPTQSP